MKNVLILGGVVAAVVGCSKGASSGELQVQGNPAINKPPSVTTPNTAPGTAPSTEGVRPGKTIGGPPQVSRSSSSLPVQTIPARQDQPMSRPPEQPKENPAAAPPKQGEKVADNFHIEMGDHAVEVEGICKLTEDSAVCWKPDGGKNESLAAELTNAIKSKNDNYSSTFQFKFLKKNRVLVLKSVVKPTKSGTSMSYNYGLMNDSYGGMEGREAWTTGNSAFSGSSGSGFDQTRTERQVLTGAFNKDTKTFPLRYQFTNSSMERKVIPFAKGRFMIDGNSYEILSISDKPDAGNPGNNMYMGGMNGMNPGAKPQKMTYIKIQVVSITNPNMILNLSPADDSGMPFAGLSDKGEPISAAEMRKQQEAENKKMMEDQKAGKGYNYNGMNRMRNYIQSIGLDPSYYNMPGRPQGPIASALNVETSKIKKLSVMISNRTVFVFDKIHLDPN